MLVVQSNIFPRMESRQGNTGQQVRVELLMVCQKMSVFFQLPGLY